MTSGDYNSRQAQMAWAQTYDGFRRLASSPERLERLLRSARNSFATRHTVPDWCGVDFLRGWAFYLAFASKQAGAGALGVEWEAVLNALANHPDAATEDRPPHPRSSEEIPLPSTFSSAPKRHKDRAFLQAKVARLWEPHVAPINHFVDEIRQEIRFETAPVGQEAEVFVPYVDPDSGGVRARVLFVLESPAGPAALGSGMLSADNNDETAKNVWTAYQASGMPRTHGLHWNAVPWYVGDGKKNAGVTKTQIERGRQYLFRLLELAPHIRVLLALGIPARKSIDGAAEELGARGVHILTAPHPSPRNYNNPDREAKQRVETAWLEALKLVESGPPR